MNKGEILKEMIDSLRASNKCSEDLERLLTMVKDAGHPNAELTMKVVAANKECEENMRRYLEYHKSYYDFSAIEEGRP